MGRFSNIFFFFNLSLGPDFNEEWREEDKRELKDAELKRACFEGILKVSGASVEEGTKSSYAQ